MKLEDIDMLDPDFEELKNSPDIQVSRYASCRTCPFLQKEKDNLEICGQCGCSIVHIVMFNFKECPIGNWKK